MQASETRLFPFDIKGTWRLIYHTIIVMSMVIGCINKRWDNDYMKVSVIAHPNSKNPRVETDLLGTIHVYVSQPPLEGRANAAVRDALAEYFKTKKSGVQMVSGEKSKVKVFEVSVEL